MGWIGVVSWVFLPALAYGALLYVYDHHEREPLWALLLLFTAGALCVPAAGQIEAGLDRVVPFLAGMRGAHEPSIRLGCFFVIAPVEEGLKLAVTALLARRTLMNEPVDGIVYAGMAALGFASAEGVAASLGGGHGVLPLRAVLSMPAHLGFSALWGAGLGAYRYWGRPVAGPFLVSLAASVAAHGGYDYLLLVHGGRERGAVVALLSLTLVLAALAFRTLLVTSPFRDATPREGSCASCARPHMALARFCAGCGHALRTPSAPRLPLAFAPTVWAFGASFTVGCALLVLSARYQDVAFRELAARTALGSDQAFGALLTAMLSTSAFCGLLAGALPGRHAVLESLVGNCLLLLSAFVWLSLEGPAAMLRLWPAVPLALALSASLAIWVRRRGPSG